MSCEFKLNFIILIKGKKEKRPDSPRLQNEKTENLPFHITDSFANLLLLICPERTPFALLNAELFLGTIRVWGGDKKEQDTIPSSTLCSCPLEAKIALFTSAGFYQLPL